MNQVIDFHEILYDFFLIGMVGGGVQLGPLGPAATNRPIVPAPGDYDDGEIGGMVGRGNQSTQRKPSPVLCLPQTPHAAQTQTQANKEITDKLNLKNSKRYIFITPLLIVCSRYLSRYSNRLQAGQPGFNPWKGHNVQTSSRAHPASHLMDTRLLPQR
jgi:hypothetical protein